MKGLADADLLHFCIEEFLAQGRQWLVQGHVLELVRPGNDAVNELDSLLDLRVVCSDVALDLELLQGLRNVRRGHEGRADLLRGTAASRIGRQEGCCSHGSCNDEAGPRQLKTYLDEGKTEPHEEVATLCHEPATNNKIARLGDIRHHHRTKERHTPRASTGSS